MVNNYNQYNYYASNTYLDFLHILSAPTSYPTTVVITSTRQPLAIFTKVKFDSVCPQSMATSYLLPQGFSDAKVWELTIIQPGGRYDKLTPTGPPLISRRIRLINKYFLFLSHGWAVFLRAPESVLVRLSINCPHHNISLYWLFFFSVSFLLVLTSAFWGQSPNKQSSFNPSSGIAFKVKAFYEEVQGGTRVVCSCSYGK